MYMPEYTERKTEEKIVNFLDLDVSKISFSKPKPNKYNGKQIGILYAGKKHYMLNMKDIHPLV